MATPDPDPKVAQEEDAKNPTEEMAPEPRSETEIVNLIHDLLGNGDEKNGEPGETENDTPVSSPPTQSPEQDAQTDEDLERAAIIKSLEQLELENLTEIAEPFHDLPLICMSESTDMALCYRLDPQSDILSGGDEGYVKDYRGMAEWVGLEDVFIKYLTRTESKWKTTDVLAKWSTLEVEPRPTLGNLQRCLCDDGGIDRPDVITDLAKLINKDAFKWKMEKYRANTTKPEIIDDTWQLTRQDVITGKRTYYTCCLIYADEDEGTASMITNLFKAVKKEAIFFNPQFDLKVGKYVQESTAQVIEERCAGRVIFVISEYFFASRVCQFTVQFAKGLDVVITGKKTYYTACLVFADEDDGMAEVIHKLYTRCYPQATFFRPQFDMKRGKYELDTTGAVIQERCGGKAIFLLSEYFFASDVCQFAVSFTAAVCKGAGVGNLIPFHMTPNSEHVPAVLKGISGIRWFRKSTRKYSWQMVTDTILAQDIQQEEISALYKRINELVDSEPSFYLGEAPYDSDVGPPGEPIKIIEPEGMVEYLEEQTKAFQSRMAPPPAPLTKRDKLVNAISSFKTKLFKSKSLSDIGQSSSDPSENDSGEVIYQRTSSPKLDLSETGLGEKKKNGRRNLRQKLECLFPGKGRSTSFLSLLGIGEVEYGTHEKSEDQHSVYTDDFVMVDENCVRAEGSDGKSFEESCRVQISPDRSSITFERNPSSNEQGEADPVDADTDHQQTEHPAVVFFSSSPKEEDLPVENCELSMDANSNVEAGLDDEHESNQHSVEHVNVTSRIGAENEGFAHIKTDAENWTILENSDIVEPVSTCEKMVIDGGIPKATVV